MAVEFKTVEAIGSLVALLRVAEDSAVHHYEQDEAFHPGIFPGLILLARFAAERAGEEFKQAVVAAEVSRWNKNLQGERDELQQKILEVAAERDELRAQLAELTKKVGELPAEPYRWRLGDEIECNGVTRQRVIDRSEGWVFLEGVESGLPQPEWERRGWKLHRKASDLGIQQLTPREVEISDSTSTDGESQS